MAAPPVTVEVLFDKLDDFARLFPRETQQIIREQVMQSEADVKTNIVKYDYVDTGATLNSTQGRMTGEFAGEVSVGTEYAMYGNYGTRHQPARPFFSDAADKARREFPQRFSALEDLV